MDHDSVLSWGLMAPGQACLLVVKYSGPCVLYGVCASLPQLIRIERVDRRLRPTTTLQSVL